MRTASPTIDCVQDDQDRRIAEAFGQERGRLRGFVRNRLADPAEVEDVLQDVFTELVEAYRLAKPIGNLGAWLFQVARNRITDLFRRKKAEPFPEGLEDLLPSADAGPDAAYARTVLLEALADALEDLPPEQRDVFLAHEVEGRSFRELAASTGRSINTLLSRKRYAVLHLRERLLEIHDEYRKGGRP